MAYLTNQRQHHGICGTFRVLTTGEALLEQHTSEHDGWELTFMPKRSCDPAKMQIRGKAFEYNPDTFLLYNGAETHTEMYSESISSTDTHRVDAIVLHSDFLDRLFAAEGVPAGEILFDGVQFKTTPRITHLIRTLFALRDLPNISLFTYDCLATELAAELALQHRHSHSAKLRDLATTGHFPSNLVRAKRTISERALDSTLNIDDVASAAGLSKFHFIRSFRQHVGTTPRQYLNALRLDLAKDSLAKGNSVLETALANGFCSVSGFNKAFRRGAGMTPKRSRASL